jgi:hypothetical protein
MRTWAFAALLLATFVVSWFAYFRQAWWAWLALITFALAAPYVHKRWTGPEWVDRLNPRLEQAMPRFWAGLGWIAVVFGWCFMVVAPICLIVGLVNRDYSVVAGNAIAFLFAYVLFLRGGRWLVRNRRQPTMHYRSSLFISRRHRRFDANLCPAIWCWVCGQVRAVVPPCDWVPVLLASASVEVRGVEVVADLGFVGRRFLLLAALRPSSHPPYSRRSGANQEGEHECHRRQDGYSNHLDVDQVVDDLDRVSVAVQLILPRGIRQQIALSERPIKFAV